VQARTYFGEVRRLQSLLEFARQEKEGAMAALQQQHDEEKAALRQRQRAIQSQGAALDEEPGRRMGTAGRATRP